MSIPSEILDIVEHLVNTHSVWNGNLSQVEAKAKVAAVRAAEAAADAAVAEAAPGAEVPFPAVTPPVVPNV